MSNDGNTDEEKSKEYPPVCPGDIVKTPGPSRERSHDPVEVKVVTREGSLRWKCPECETELDEFYGVSPTDVQ